MSEDAPATKRDLEGLAAKRDLDGLVTKQWFDEHAATKRDLDELRRDMRAELASKADLDELRGELRGELRAVESRLSAEIQQNGMRVANVMIEHIQKRISVVDEKYQDLPRDHGNLRSDFDAHAGDTRIHVSPPVTPPKRARRSPP